MSISLLKISDSKDCKNVKHSEHEHNPENWTFEWLSREKGGFFFLWSRCSKWSAFWFPFYLRWSNNTLSPPMLENWHLLLPLSIRSLSLFFFLFSCFVCLFVWSTSSSFSLPGIYRPWYFSFFFFILINSP